MMKPWNRLLREAVESSALEAFKSCVSWGIEGHGLAAVLVMMGGGVDSMILKILNNAMIL